MALPADESAARALEIGARLAQAPSEQLLETAFRAELEAQLPLAGALSRVDLAHTLVLAENGLIPPPQARELLTALRRLEDPAETFRPEPAKGDLYTNREAWLLERTPAAAWLGAGRARREALTTAYHLQSGEELLALAAALGGLIQTLLTRSADYAGALMPDYTYLQQAQPTCFGHYLSAFAGPALRDLARIRELYRRLNRSPAGCGSSNGSRLPQSRQRLAQLLGFDGLVAHGRDAMWQADLPIELAALLSAMLVNLDRLAEDLQIFASAEFALVELDDSHARASKIMPQKKNPFALTYIRGLANRMTGTLAASAALGRTPSGQPDNRLSLYGELPRALAESRGAVALMAEVIARLRFNPGPARAKLDGGFALATELAEVLVLETGLPFRDAHRLVGRLVQNHLADGGFGALTSGAIADTAEELLGRRLTLSPAALASALDPEAAVAARRQPGGAAPEALAEILEQDRRQLQEATRWRQQRQAEQEASALLLARGLAAFLGSGEA